MKITNAGSEELVERSRASQATTRGRSQIWAMIQMSIHSGRRNDGFQALGENLNIMADWGRNMHGLHT
jgi:hypothetical protein